MAFNRPACLSKTVSIFLDGSCYEALSQSARVINKISRAERSGLLMSLCANTKGKRVETVQVPELSGSIRHN